MANYQLTVAELTEQATKLRTFDRVWLSGTLYTARDAAHKKLMVLLQQRQALPFELQGAVIYYAGPTPSPSHLPIGSCGPTTSGRMDPFAPQLLDCGLRAMIGKGQRSQSVVDAIVRNKALYLCAIGGAGALACKSITACEVVAFEELGCESIKKLTVQNFPLIVAVDTTGTDIFKVGRETYLTHQKQLN